MATVAERWEHFWSKVGDDDSLPWHAEPPSHTATMLAAVRRHLPPGLPLVDVGCGDATATRWLAAELGCPAFGIDSSPSALTKATARADDASAAASTAASGGNPGVELREVNVLDAEAVENLAAEIGPAIVWSRFLLHHLQDTAARHAALRSMATLAGPAGRIVNLEITTLDADGFSAYADREHALRALLQAGVQPGQLVPTEIIQLHQDIGLKIVAFEAGVFPAARSHPTDPPFTVPAEWVVSCP